MTRQKMASNSLATITEALQNLKIPLSQVKPTTTSLGRGSYGKVFEVEYDGKVCAGKEIHGWMVSDEFTSKREQQKAKEDFLRECHLWSTLRHPNVVQFLGIYYPSDDESGLPVMLMEKMQESVTSLVEKHDDIPLLVKLSILQDVSLGLRYLHGRSPPIVHRDLSPNNILVTPHLETKITDLGVAKAMMTGTSKTMTQTPGTLVFMSPEALEEKPVYGPPLDVFSFGGVILHITTQQWPNPKGIKQVDPVTRKRIILSEVERRQQYLDMMAGGDAELKPLVEFCLEDDPEMRPVMSDISEQIKKMKEVTSKKTGHDGMDPFTWLASMKLTSQLQQLTLKESVNTTTPDLFSKSMNIQWKEGAPLPVAAAVHTAVLYNNAVYVGGGHTESDLIDPFQVFVYHPDTNKWDIPIKTSTKYFALVVLMNKLLILGGSGGVYVIPNNKVLVLDESQWKDYTEIPTKRLNVSVASYKTMMIVMGGLCTAIVLSTTEVFDDTTGQWFTCNDLPYPHRLQQTVILEDTLYVLNGYTQDGPSNDVYAAPLDNLSSCHQLDWKCLTDTPWRYSAAAATGLDNKYLLVVGGDSTSDTVCVWKTTKGVMVASSSWESVGCLPVVSKCPSTICYGNQLIVIGGFEDDENTVSNAVHIGTFQQFCS
ncbi:uncharacterized protein [Dysidea avara]|uniref:uncharacterized protein isoform X2 n=1 Tax=Dysidea avara TaxID=196820 RepID=UPI00331710C7